MVIAGQRSVCIMNVDEYSQRPYQNVAATGIDFSVQGEFTYVNDILVPEAPEGKFRDPNLFLKMLDDKSSDLFSEKTIRDMKEPEICQMNCHFFDSNDIPNHLIEEY